MRSWQHLLVGLIGMAALSSCATTVRPNTSFDPQKYPEISFLAFKVAQDHGYRYTLEVEKDDTREHFAFVLNDDVPNSVALYVGPFAVYRRYLEETKDPPLRLIPLPIGTYKLKYIRTFVGGSSVSYPTRTESFTLRAGMMTYIGTYDLRLRMFLIVPGGVAGTVLDDGLDRSRQLGLEKALITELCHITK
jgi:hypothetical protein